MVMLYMKQALEQTEVIAGILIFLILFIPRALGSFAGPAGGLARLLVCSVSPTAMALRTGTLRFGPRCFRFDQNLKNFGTGEQKSD